jgi:hypothetical protein
MEFNESAYIAASIYQLIVIGGLCLAVLEITNMTPFTKRYITACMIFVLSTLIIGTLFAPKMKSIIIGDDGANTRSNILYNVNSRNADKSCLDNSTEVQAPKPGKVSKHGMYVSRISGDKDVMKNTLMETKIQIAHLQDGRAPIESSVSRQSQNVVKGKEDAASNRANESSSASKMPIAETSISESAASSTKSYGSYVPKNTQAM